MMRAVRKILAFALLLCCLHLSAQVLRRPQYPVGAWTPASLGSIVITWFEGDYGAGSVSNDPVITWSDRSSNAADATQSTSTYRPTYQANVINGHPIVRFDGDDDYLQIGNKYGGVTAAHVFLVAKITNDPPMDDAKTGLWYFTTTGTNTHWPYSDGTIYDSFGSSGRKDTVNPTPSLTSFRLYSVLSKSGAWTSYLDGTQLYTTGSNTVAFDTISYIGKSASTYYLKGDIALLIICNTELTGSNLSSMKTYIGTKYGLTIS